MPQQGDVFSALLFFCIANIGFEMGGVFLNAYLPEIAHKHKIGRISGYGWSFGYVGGLIALAFCFVSFVLPDNPLNPLTGNILDKSSYEHIRIINVFEFLSILNKSNSSDHAIAKKGVCMHL